MEKMILGSVLKNLFPAKTQAPAVSPPSAVTPESDHLVALERRIQSLEEQMRRNAGYLARQEIERLNNQVTDSLRLEPYGFKVYSQNDEDGILEEIFRRICIDQGTFCEIGVEDGLECNSLYLSDPG